MYIDRDANPSFLFSVEVKLIYLHIRLELDLEPELEVEKDVIKQKHANLIFFFAALSTRQFFGIYSVYPY